MDDNGTLARLRRLVVAELANDTHGLVPLRVAAVAFLLLAPWVNACRATQQTDPLVIVPLTPEDAVVDLRQDGGPPVRRGVPPRPESWQKVPPCDPDGGEVAINGACYIELRKRPPCGKTLEHETGCFRPVGKTPREPSSMER